ncbi:MAG: hypothetical protein NC433_07435 [Clostridiales bacterium]|nr:hypothetical protein [Clostridiales bacterium]
MKNKICSLCSIILLLVLTACGTEHNDSLVAESENESGAVNEVEHAAESGTENETEADAEFGTENEVDIDMESETKMESEAGTEPEIEPNKAVEPIFRTIELAGQSAFFADSDKTAEPISLSLISETGNGISEPTVWVAENGLYLPMINGPLSESTIQVYREEGLDYDYWKQYTDYTLFFDENYVYEWNSIASVVDPNAEIYVYDLESRQYLYGAEYASDEWYLMGNCAYVRDGILYTGNICRGYAMPNSCYLFAYDLENDEMLWRSEDQTYNSMNFIVKDDVIICGYGFTAEDDYIYQLDMHTGKVISKTKVAKMPDLIVEQDGKLYVHTYSYDYVFEIGESCIMAASDRRHSDGKFGYCSNAKHTEGTSGKV